MRKNTKVAFLLTRISKTGGITRVVHILTSELVKNNFLDIHLIGYQRADEPSLTYNWAPTIHYHELTDSKKSMKAGILSRVHNKLKLYLNQNKIDILVICGQLVGLMAVLACTNSSTKLIYWSHSSFKNTKGAKFKRINEYITTKFTDITISLTKEDEVNYKKLSPAKNVIQIYNPTDPKLLLKSKNTPYKTSSKHIISVGRLTPEKNFFQLIQIASKVLKNTSETEWHIYGSGPLKQQLQEEINKNNLQERVILKGQVENLYDIYNDYSILVMTSLFEGFPMVLIEGMANKLPLVSFDISTGPKEIIINEVNGFLISPFNGDDMALRIVQLLNDKDLRTQFSIENSKLIENFQIQSISKRWIKLFNEVLH